MNLVELLECGITERGNTSLINPETGGGFFYAEIAEGKWLEVTHYPENYPAWNFAIIDQSKAQTRTYIEENLGSWVFQKNNIGANASDNRPVDLEYVMERIGDHLYVYRDNKDYETKDTVTVIHDYLESKEWSLDITDIETIRQEFDEE